MNFVYGISGEPITCALRKFCWQEYCAAAEACTLSPNTIMNPRLPRLLTTSGAVLPPTLAIPPPCTASWPPATEVSPVVTTKTLMPSSSSSWVVVAVCV